MPNITKQKSTAPALDPMLVVQSRADALYRAARECCRQHDRAAKMSGTDEPELEHRHLDALCHMCDGSLAELCKRTPPVRLAANGRQPSDAAAIRFGSTRCLGPLAW